MIIEKEDPCSHQERQGKQGSSWAKYDDIYVWKCNNENHHFAFYRLSLKAKKGGIMFHYLVKLYCETHSSPSMKSVPSLLRIVSKLNRRSPTNSKCFQRAKESLSKCLWEPRVTGGQHVGRAGQGEGQVTSTQSWVAIAEHRSLPSHDVSHPWQTILQKHKAEKSRNPIGSTLCAALSTGMEIFTVSLPSPGCIFSWSRVAMLWTLLVSATCSPSWLPGPLPWSLVVVWDILWEGGDVRIYPSEVRGKHCSWRQGIQGKLPENWDFSVPL